jgi:hypothetical protein
LQEVDVANPLREDTQQTTREQRIAAYRARIRAKLAARGITGADLDRQTEELLQRGPVRFTVASIVDDLHQ